MTRAASLLPLVCLGLMIGLAGRSMIAAAEDKPAKKRSPEVKKTEPAGTGKFVDRKFETAVFAGGCFWCMEFAFEQLAGVWDVESGYCGGSKGTATYDLVHQGTTKHAEVVRVTYDPAKISYDKLLDAFFDSHDPTQLNRQGEDEGRQYRSAIFVANDEQQKMAKAKIAALEKEKVYKRSIKTRLEPLKEFYPAEAYHQDFVRRNPNLPYVQRHAVPKALQLRTKQPDLMRK